MDGGQLRNEKHPLEGGVDVSKRWKWGLQITGKEDPCWITFLAEKWQIFPERSRLGTDNRSIKNLSQIIF